MKKFFVHDGKGQSGPFDATELKLMNLNRQTPVWYEGLSEWTVAGEIPELKFLFASTTPPPFGTASYEAPPTYSSSPSYYLSNQKKKSPYRVLGIIIVFLVIVLAAKLIYDQIDHQNAIESRQSAINAEEDLKMTTRENITSYVTAKLSDYSYNQLGGIENLRVVVENNTGYIIDEVEVKLYYYKPNGSVWDTRTVRFNLLNPNTKSTIRVPDTYRGVKVDKEIISIKSRVLGLE